MRTPSQKGSFPRKSESLKQALTKAKAKGVKIKIAAPLSKKTDKAVEELKDVAELRHAANIQARACLIDGEQMMIMLKSDSDVHPTYDAGIWVNTDFFGNALKSMFDNEWDSMKKAE